MHENVYVLLRTVTAFMFQYQNNIYEVTFMQLRDPTAFMFQECSTIFVEIFAVFLADFRDR